MLGNTILNQDFKEFIESLNTNKVRYLVVGGYAVAIHGYPRYTKDLDIWIEPELKNSARVIKSLNEFGFGSLGLVKEDFLVLNQIIQLGYPPARIDLISTLEGVDFTSCYNKKRILVMDGVKVCFLGRQELIKNKRTTGRSQDLADIENLDKKK